jgi:hypothetical protein
MGVSMTGTDQQSVTGTANDLAARPTRDYDPATDATKATYSSDSTGELTSVTATNDPLNSWTYSYDPWGDIRSDQMSIVDQTTELTDSTTMGFQGDVTDDETGPRLGLFGCRPGRERLSTRASSWAVTRGGSDQLP